MLGYVNMTMANIVTVQKYDTIFNLLNRFSISLIFSSVKLGTLGIMKEKTPFCCVTILHL